MVNVFEKLGKVFAPKGVEITDDYVELEADVEKKQRAKVLIKMFMMKEFDDIKPILDAIREGYTISVVNIAPLKEKDMATLKRAIDKLKKTVEANDGDIAGLAESLLIVTPSFARVHRGKEEKPQTTVIQADALAGGEDGSN